MTCECDLRAWPPRLVIPPGLPGLPRQLVTFAELRTEMLARARFQPALAEWRARAADDYGLMLLELWAYVGELLSIYDKAIADESYVRTAKLRPSLRRLVAGLGYIPRPAVAATAEVALLADGKQPVALPAGTAFRSGAFAGEPPQVFELTKPATIFPQLNRWKMSTAPAVYVNTDIAAILLDPHGARVASGDVVIVELSPYSEIDGHARKVTAVDRIVDGDGRRLVQITFDRPISPYASATWSQMKIRKPTRRCDLSERGASGTVNIDPLSVTVDMYNQTWWEFLSDGRHPHLRSGDRVAIEVQDKSELRCLRMHGRDDYPFMLVPGGASAEVDIDLGNNKTATVPPIAFGAVTTPRTLVRTTEDPNDWFRKLVGDSTWTATIDPTQIVIHFDLVDAGTIVAPLGPTLAAIDPLRAVGVHQPINSTPSASRFILRDKEDRGVAFGGSIDLASGAITRDPNNGWAPPLAAQVNGYGNVVTVVRGETVPQEVLGSGDPSTTHQAFTLKKKPLTYINAPGAPRGVASTLIVWVGGVAWDEVPTFFGHGGWEHVYVVRQDDTGASTVSFGDGIRGARLPAGVGNVVASYRYGAGAAAPPANSIAQLAKPVPGLRQVVGPLAAGGGSDAEPAEFLRVLAPRTAVLLGRAISLDDMEVAAREVGGVVTARADWTWDKTRQRPVIKVWVLGGAGVLGNVAEQLRALTEPGTPIQVVPAQPTGLRPLFDLEIDPRRVLADVLEQVKFDLLAPWIGWLTPARQGIGNTLFRSQLVAALLTIPGVVGVRSLNLMGGPWLTVGTNPGIGHYFDFSLLDITGSPP